MKSFGTREGYQSHHRTEKQEFFSPIPLPIIPLTTRVPYSAFL
jgi:hypothetical protein